MAGISTFSTKDLDFFYYSDRAKVDGKVVSHLVQFISAAKHTLDVAIYDLKNKEVLTALKKISGKVQLTILYDGGAGYSEFKFSTADVSTVDYFHPSVTGQRDVAAFTWAHSYWPSM